MSDGPSNLERRQKALQAVRRHVRRLEIETHRVKAHLARLEVKLVFEALLERLPDVRAVDPTSIDRNRSTLVVGIDRLPAVFTPVSKLDA